jgi:hypothetical protein
VRWTPIDVAVRAAKPGINLYTFDLPWPGYISHCHILYHEG